MKFSSFRFFVPAVFMFLFIFTWNSAMADSSVDSADFDTVEHSSQEDVSNSYLVPVANRGSGGGGLSSLFSCSISKNATVCANKAYAGLQECVRQGAWQDSTPCMRAVSTAQDACLENVAANCRRD